jgi:hypothetical protein
MDFKSLLSKLDSMEAPASTPAAPTLDKAVQLNEDAQLRVLAGQTTYVAEAKKKKDEEKKDEKKVDEAAEKTATTWTDSKGNKHPATKVKGDKYTGKEAEKEDKPKSKKDESVEPEFKSKFMKMVEAKKEEADKKKADKKKKMEEGAKPDFLDMDKDGDKKEPMKKAVADKKDGPKKGVNPFAKKDVKEATKTDKPWTDMSGKKQPGTAVKGDKYTGKEAEKDAKKDKNESVVRSKRVVAESADNVLSFRDMIKLVQESGGQQAIDPIDTTLFAWAQRVAASKYTESAKAEVFAGMLYERNGGRFEMYDVLSED